jgi:hypothetical protein
MQEATTDPVESAAYITAINTTPKLLIFRAITGPIPTIFKAPEQFAERLT